MILERVTDAKLELHKGPFFPEGIDELNSIYNNLGVLQDLVRLPYLISGNYGMRTWIGNPVTSDRYIWYGCVKIGVRHQTKKNELRGIITVLFPNIKIEEGFVSDRSIAFYYHGEISENDLKELMKKIMEGLQKLGGGRS